MKANTFLFGFVAFSLVWVIFPIVFLVTSDVFGFPRVDNFFLKAVGIIFWVLDLTVFVYCSNLFVKFGKGTPIPTESPKIFVEKGVYRFVRNPIYIGHLIGIIGIAMVFGRLLLFVYPSLAFIGVHLVVVYMEEPHLRKKFKSSYIDYTRRVKRWGLF